MNKLLTLATTLGAFASASVLVAEQPEDSLAKRDLERLMGAWRVVSAGMNGTKELIGNESKFVVIIAADGAWTHRIDDRVGSSGKIRLGPSEKPKAVDIHFTTPGEKKELALGIYEIDEKSLRLCFALPEKPRPREFAAPAGSSHLVVEFVKESR